VRDRASERQQETIIKSISGHERRSGVAAQILRVAGTSAFLSRLEHTHNAHCILAFLAKQFEQLPLHIVWVRFVMNCQKMACKARDNIQKTPVRQSAFQRSAALGLFGNSSKETQPNVVSALRPSWYQKNSGKSQPPKNGLIALWPSTNGAIPYFLVLPGRELSITEITEYTYFSP